MKTVHLLAAILLATLAQPAFALRIVLTNDDGLTSNLAATYVALKADGHDVIVSVPCTSQSGRGAAIVMLSTKTIVADNDRQVEAEGGCHNGAAPAGAPAVGPFTKAGFDNGDYHYVHGTPVMATMYALDVLAPARWGKEKAPDLVLSGPNEGQNLGHVVIHSGTVGNAQFAAGRGLPAIALSAGTDTVDNTTLANPLSAIVARHAARLVKMLQDQAGKGTLLPPGLVLNVNFPNGPTADLAWAFARIGSFDLYQLHFRDRAPWGISMTTRELSGASAKQARDEAVVSAKAISISAMQVGFESSAAQQQWLQGLLNASSKTKRKTAH